MVELNRAIALVAIFLAPSIGLVQAEESPDDAVTPPPAEWTPAKKNAVDWIDANARMLKEINRTIWTFAEPGMMEYRSAAYLIEALSPAPYDRRGPAPRERV